MPSAEKAAWKRELSHQALPWDLQHFQGFWPKAVERSAFGEELGWPATPTLQVLSHPTTSHATWTTCHSPLPTPTNISNFPSAAHFPTPRTSTGSWPSMPQGILQPSSHPHPMQSTIRTVSKKTTVSKTSKFSTNRRIGAFTPPRRQPNAKPKAAPAPPGPRRPYQHRGRRVRQ